MRRFVHRENIKHLRGALERTTNEVDRRNLQQLLNEAEAKLREEDQKLWSQAFSEPSNMQMTCPSCRASMSIWRFQEMFIQGKGRFMAAMFLCDKCNRTQLVLGDRPIRLDTAAE